MKCGARQQALLALILVCAQLASGCVAAAGAAAGAGAAVYLTDRGASSLVNASLDQTAKRTRRAFSDLGIRMKEVETKERERTFKGATRDLDVTAELGRREDGATRVEVTARRSAVSWDKEYAQRVVARIVGVD
ncbi:MAG: DUF3568 family protein [Longimicrobiales bacterium]